MIDVLSLQSFHVCPLIMILNNQFLRSYSTFPVLIKHLIFSLFSHKQSNFLSKYFVKLVMDDLVHLVLVYRVDWSFDFFILSQTKSNDALIYSSEVITNRCLGSFLCSINNFVGLFAMFDLKLWILVSSLLNWVSLNLG